MDKSTGNYMSVEAQREVCKRLDESSPRVMNANPDFQRRQMAQEVLPEGYSLSERPRQATSDMFDGLSGASFGTGGGGSTMFQLQKPYFPEIECFLKGTPVNMADGSSKKIEDVVVGDQVIDRTGSIQVVERQWSSGTPEELVEIQTLGGLTFNSTVYHHWPVWAWCRECQCGCGEEVNTLGRRYIQDHYKGGRKPTTEVHVRGCKHPTNSGHQVIPEGYDPLRKLRADEIKRGDFLLMPRSFDEIETDVTEEKVRLLGYYIAEGNIDYDRQGKPYSVTWTFGLHEKDTHVDDASKILTRLGVPYSVQDMINKGVCRIRLVNDYGEKRDQVQSLVGFLIEHGNKIAATKKLSAEVMRWPLSLKRELIKGMVRGDGCQNWKLTKGEGKAGNSFMVNYATVSKQLASQTQLVLAQLGFPSYVKMHPAEIRKASGKDVNCADRYTVCILPAYSLSFADVVWEENSKSREHEVKIRIRPECMMDDDFVYFPIKSIKRVANAEAVYNLTISGDESYLVSNIATYNSPDRQQYPHDRRRANAIWRMFYRYDPVFGNAVEMYADMLVSDFDIVVPKGAGTEIQETLEYMCDRVKVVEIMRQIVIEYLTIGETFPHLFFSDELGIWNYCGFHDPDYIDVKDAPLIRMDPILTFEPDARLRKLLADTSPESQEIRKKFPTEFVQKVMARQPIRLAPTNVSHIARRLHPYDERGTSLASRLWRIFMVEDAVYASTIATYRRNACFVAGTQVLTSEGSKSIEDVKVDDKVISGEGTFQTVEAAWGEPAEEIVEITTMGSEKLECTPNHRFKMWARPRTCACGCGGELPNTSRGTRRSYLTGHYGFRRDPKTGRMTGDTAKWNVWSEQPSVKTLEGYKPIQTLNAEDIVTGDYLLIPRKFDVFPVEVNEETRAKARLLGYYVAEGHRAQVTKKGFEKDYGLVWTFSLAEYDTWAEDVVQLGTSLGLSLYKTRELNTSEKDVRVGKTSVSMRRQKDTAFSNWCVEHAGMYSAQKRLSDEVMRWPLELKEELLIGMYRGDGHKNKRRQGAEYGTVSTSLAYQVRIILAQLGVYASITRSEREIETWNDYYSVKAHGGGGRKLRELIWGDLDHYSKEYSNSWTWMDDDYIYVPVRGVEKRLEKTTVYNLTVSGDHSYIANGVATLNSPLRVVKLGDQAAGWIPPPEKEAQFLQMLAQCENDPAAVLVWNYGVQFEAWGTNDRATTIRGELDTIERVKFQALGLSKAMVSGESTFAGQKSGLQVFLRRLLSLRQYIESVWLQPKFFRPISEMNEWVKATNTDDADSHTIKRTASNEAIQNETQYILPEIKWKNQLDPQVDGDLLKAYEQLEKSFGIKLTKTRVCAAVGFDFKEEEEAELVEYKDSATMKQQILGPALDKKKKEEQAAKPGGGGAAGAPGSGAKPPGADGKPGKGDTPDGSHPPGSGGEQGTGALSESVDSAGGDALVT